MDTNPASLPRLPLARLAVWRFTADRAEVRALDTSRAQESSLPPVAFRFFDDILCRSYLDCRELEDEGRLAGQADRLAIRAGGSCTVGYEESGELVWVELHYIAGRLWARPDFDDDPLAGHFLVWDKEEGWINSLALKLFGLTMGRNFAQQARSEARWMELEQRQSNLQAFCAERVVEEIQSVLRPRPASKPEAEPFVPIFLSITGRCCRCGAAGMAGLIADDLVPGVSREDHFCLACDRWIELSFSPLRPLRPSEMPYPMKLCYGPDVGEGELN